MSRHMIAKLKTEDKNNLENSLREVMHTYRQGKKKKNSLNKADFSLEFLKAGKKWHNFQVLKDKMNSEPYN